MKKQEALKRIEAQKETIIELTGWAVFRYIKALIEQLDEPQKVVLPQFVADWYEENKDDFETNLLDFIENIPDIYEKNEFEMFERWLLETNTKPFQTLVNMHQFGYKVEKEKRYLVKVKGVYHGDLGYAENFNGYSFYNKDRNLSGIKYEHTRKELEEAGFGWVFSCEGVEVEEVE